MTVGKSHIDFCVILKTLYEERRQGHLMKVEIECSPLVSKAPEMNSLLKMGEALRVILIIFGARNCLAVAD